MPPKYKPSEQEKLVERAGNAAQALQEFHTAARILEWLHENGEWAPPQGESITDQAWRFAMGCAPDSAVTALQAIGGTRPPPRRAGG